MKHFTRILIYAAIATIVSFAGYSNLSAHTISSDTTSFYVIKLHKEIDASSARMFTDALREAEKQNADYCILNLNTYGGALDAADSIRSAIIRTPIPVISFINIQAASAGALISIACDSIYMTNGSSIGAATVVDGSGNVLPDKYQSFMRAMMRATAESHGKKVIINGKDTIEVWHRDPAIAESMVSADSVLSFTPTEAMANSYCEGMAENIVEVIQNIVGKSMEYTITEHKITATNRIIYFFLNPVIQGLLLMLIMGGIYFEFQTPGIGFPLAAAVLGMVLYFVPLYLEGFVQNWEIIFFFLGILLLLMEIFVIPGFGIAGICGILLIVITLAFAMIDNDIVFEGGTINFRPMIKPFAIVLVSSTTVLFLSIYLANRLFPTRAFSHIALKTHLSSGKEGFVGVEKEGLNLLAGKKGCVATDLKPQGTVEVEGKRYPAQMIYGYAQKGEIVEISHHEGGRLYCRK